MSESAATPPEPSRWRWFRWWFGDLVGRWVSQRLGGLIEGETW